MQIESMRVAVAPQLASEVEQSGRAEPARHGHQALHSGQRRGHHPEVLTHHVGHRRAWKMIVETLQEAGRQDDIAERRQTQHQNRIGHGTSAASLLAESAARAG